MLDMGFLPEIRKLLRFLPAKRQTLFFSATMPAPIVTLTREMLTNPATIRIERNSAPPTGITQAVYPVSQELKAALFLALLERGEMNRRSSSRARSIAPIVSPSILVRSGVKAERIHGNRSQTQRTAALAGFKSGHVSRFSSRPTSRRAESTSKSSATWSTSTCRWCRRITSIALVAPDAPMRRARRSLSWRPMKRVISATSRRQSASDFRE